MLKKRIKALIVSCVLISVLPNISYSINKDDFLKFLINSSYPEVKEKKEKKTSNNNQNNDDFIEFYIGEENIPKIEEEKEVNIQQENKNKDKNEDKNEDNKQDEASNILTSSKYINEVRLTKENPRMLLYHSHAAETYSNSPDGNYHSKDKDNSVISVGELLTEELSKKGWGVVHSTKYHDYPDYNASYKSSLQTIETMMKQHSTIDIAIDVHRDAREVDTNEKKEKEKNRISTNYNGEDVAKFLFVVGQKNPNVEKVRSLANDITDFAKSKYPELVLPVVEKQFGRFNQYVAKNHLLIEIGSNGSTTEEAKASVKYVANVLDEYFKSR